MKAGIKVILINKKTNKVTGEEIKEVESEHNFEKGLDEFVEMMGKQFFDYMEGEKWS